MFTRRTLTTIGAALVLVFGTALPATASRGEPAAPAYGAAAYIVGGAAVTDAEAPWTALVRRSGNVCSGSMIAPTWVLTAASCLTETMSVSVGSVNRWGTPSTRQPRSR